MTRVRLTVYIALTVLTALGLVADLVSDLFITRSASRLGWNWTVTLLAFAWVLASRRLWRDNK